MFKKLKIRNKLLIAFTVVAVVAVGMIAFFAFTVGSDALETESFNKLTAVREMKASQIEDYFQQISDQAITLSKDRMIIDAMRDFEEGFHTIDSELGFSEENIDLLDARIEDYYQNQFLDRLIPNLLVEVPVADYWPEEKNARILQYQYAVSNPNETGRKDLLNYPEGDDSSYAETHALYHPIVRDFLKRFGYYDIFLVAEDGDIVYSVFKEVDFGTSLLDGPYSDTNFADAFRAAIDSSDEDFVFLADFEPYHPSYAAPAAFIASPIYDGQEKLGVLAFQMPIDRINDIMTSNQNWSGVGLGESGETYLVGDDFKLRNQSRFLIEDSESYFEAINESGVPLETVGRIRNQNSTIGLQEVDTEGTRAALAGETDTAIFPDYRNVPVLSSYKPVDIPGVNWAIMSEIDEAEAFASIRSLGLRLGIGSIILIAFIIIAATLFSRTITKPIEDLQSQAGQISAGNLDTTITVDTEDEINDLAIALETMRLSNRDLISDLEDINQNLENLVAERTAELEASERRSNSIIEQSSDAIVVIDGEGKVLVWNARAEEMFGHSRDEMAGHPIRRIVPEIYLDKHEVALNRATKSGSLKNPGVTHELSALRSNGSEFPIELALAHWELEGKSFFSASIRDITDRKQAEKAIREREERIRSIVEIAPDAIISIDGEQNIVMFNSQAERTFGYSVDEVLGQPLTMLIPEASRAIHPQEVNSYLNETISTRAMDSRREIAGRRKDGTIFPAEAGISKLELDGQVIFTAFFRDITERKQAAEALQRSEERLAFALEGSNDGLWDWNPQTNAIYFSPRWQTMLGFEPGELKPVIGTWEKLVHPEDLDRVNGIMAEHLVGNSPSYEAEYRLQSKGGGWAWILARGKVASYDEDGKPIRFVGTHVDISERKRLEADIANQLSFIRTLVDTIPNPMFAMGPDQRYTLFNRAYEEAYGVSADDLIGKSVLDIEELTPEQRQRYFDENTLLLEQGGMNHDEVDIHFVDGKLHTILNWVTAYRQADGAIGGLVGITADITEQKKLEAEIANQLSFVQSLVDTIPNPLFVKGVDTKFIAFNSAYEEAFGINKDDYVGKTILEMENLPNESRLAYQEEDSGLLETGGEFSREIQIPYSDQQIHDVIYQVTTFDLPDGQRGGLMGLLTDVSQMKELERQLAIANERMSTELNFARDIQLDMLPLIFPAFPNRTEVTVHAALESAREVGGDFYDFYFLDDDHLCFVIGDVAGKGAPGALMMAVSKTLIKSRAADDDEPASILTHVNDELSQDNKSSMFVTVFLGVINVKTGEMVYTNAGHNPPYIRRRDGSLQKVDAFHGPVIGAMPGLPYQQDSDVLQPGDTILLYTDGVTEAFNEEEELFSEKRLETLLPDTSLDSAENLVLGTIDEVKRFAGEAEQSDDVTLLAVQYLGLPEEMASQELDIIIKNRYEDMEIVEEQFSEFAAENDLPDAVRQAMSIVLDEMLNNIISYAYQGEKEKEIEVGFDLSGNRLVLTIKDAGVPFNPFTRETPDISESIEKREIGGLGIHMVRSLMDEVAYQRLINKNVVTLVKLIEETGQKN